MRITAPSRAGRSLTALLLSAVALASIAGAAEKPATPYDRIARLASFLSDGEPIGALESFDKNMKGYGAIAENIAALAAQTDVLCSIDVVADKEADDEASPVHHLDLDWYMTLKSKADPSLIEKRRLRVTAILELSKTKPGGVWRITVLDPPQILAPITIR